MNRRGFLGTLAAALIVRKFPAPEPLVAMPRVLFKGPTFTHVTYGLGFRVTEELMEDSYYGVGLAETMADFQREIAEYESLRLYNPRHSHDVDP